VKDSFSIVENLMIEKEHIDYMCKLKDGGDSLSQFFPPELKIKRMKLMENPKIKDVSKSKEIDDECNDKLDTLRQNYQSQVFQQIIDSRKKRCRELESELEKLDDAFQRYCADDWEATFGVEENIDHLVIIQLHLSELVPVRVTDEDQEVPVHGFMNRWDKESGSTLLRPSTVMFNLAVRAVRRELSRKRADLACQLRQRRTAKQKALDKARDVEVNTGLIPGEDLIRTVESRVLSTAAEAGRKAAESVLRSDTARSKRKRDQSNDGIRRANDAREDIQGLYHPRANQGKDDQFRRNEGNEKLDGTNPPTSSRLMEGKIGRLERRAQWQAKESERRQRDYSTRQFRREEDGYARGSKRRDADLRKTDSFGRKSRGDYLCGRREDS